MKLAYVVSEGKTVVHMTREAVSRHVQRVMSGGYVLQDESKAEMSRFIEGGGDNELWIKGSKGFQTKTVLIEIVPLED